MRMTNVSGKWNEIKRGDYQEMATRVLAKLYERML